MASTRNASLRYKIDGIDEVRAVLAGISTELQRTILAEGIREGAKPVVRHAKRLAPKETGALRRSIGAVIRRPRKKYVVYAVIGPRHGYYDAGKLMKAGQRSASARSPANYAHLLEYGHIKVTPKKDTSRRKKTATVVGYVAPRPFLTPALFAAQGESGQLMADGLIKGIEKVRVRLTRNSPRAAA